MAAPAIRNAGAARRKAGPRLENRAGYATCHVCCELLSDEDGHHYGYLCHRCAIDEHDLLIAVARDPDHPDAGLLDRSPVEIVYGRDRASRG